MDMTVDEFEHEPHFNISGSINKAAHNAAREAREAHDARLEADREVHVLIAEIEELIDRMKEAADPELTLVRTKVEASIEAVRQAVLEAAEQVQRQTLEAIEAGDNFMRQRPWEAIGVASAAGLALGFVLGRR
jgi:ElaB/YqjD/DUF883 family membrane-anchored ribosome-binding protein